MVQDRRKCSEQGSDSPSVQVSCGEKLMKSSHHNYSHNNGADLCSYRQEDGGSDAPHEQRKLRVCVMRAEVTLPDCEIDKSLSLSNVSARVSMFVLQWWSSGTFLCSFSFALCLSLSPFHSFLSFWFSLSRTHSHPLAVSFARLRQNVVRYTPSSTNGQLMSRQNLLAKDKGGTSDPFVQLGLRGLTQKVTSEPPFPIRNPHIYYYKIDTSTAIKAKTSTLLFRVSRADR